MPMPKPGQDESHDDFLARCHEALGDEFPDSEQRHAVCLRQWEGKKDMSMGLERLDISLKDCEFKFAGAAGEFSGYGAVFGNVDGKQDIVEPGAFQRTITRWAQKGRRPKMLLNHGGPMGLPVNADDLLPIGQWASWNEDRKGLAMAGRLFALGTERGQYIYEAMKAGELDGLSIGYKVPKGGATQHGDTRHLKEIDVIEVSVVTFPANDQSRVTMVKSFTIDQLREIESDLGDLGLSRKDRVIAVSYFKKLGNLFQREAGTSDLQRDADGQKQKPGATPAELDLVSVGLNGFKERMVLQDLDRSFKRIFGRS